jgi:hypothetical protein
VRKSSEVMAQLYSKKNEEAKKRKRKKASEVLAEKGIKFEDIKQEHDTSGFFQKSSAFDDGYQFGDITKTVGSSVGDLATDIAEGFFRTTEGVADTLQYGTAGVLDFFGADNAANAVRENAKFNSTGALFGKNELATDNFSKGWTDKIEKNSVMGDTADSVAQGVGQVGAAVGMGYLSGGTAVSTALTSFSSGYGNARSQAYADGMDDKTAHRAGLVSGFSEAISEQFFSGIPGMKTAGWGEKVTGKIGNTVSKFFGSKTGKVAMKLLDLSGEGAEEIVSNVLSTTGNNVMHLIDNDFTYGMENSRILKDGYQFGDITKDNFDAAFSQESFEAFVVSTLTSAFVNSGKAILSKSDTKKIITNYAEEAGITYDQAKKQLESTVEAQTKAANLPFNERVELEEKVKEQQLGYMKKGVFVEQGQQEQAFQYKETDNEQVNNMLKNLSEKSNNTVQNHSTAQMAEKLIRDLGYDVEFTTSEELIASNKPGNANGYKEGNKIVLNLDSNELASFVMGHETTHFLEQETELYDAVSSALFELATTKGKYDTDVENLTKTYEQVINNKIKAEQEKLGRELTEEEKKNISDGVVKSELTANYVGNFFTDEDFFRTLGKKDIGKLQQFSEFLKKLYYKVTGQQEKAQILEAQKLIRKVYQEYANNNDVNINNSVEVDYNQNLQKTAENTTEVMQTAAENNVEVEQITPGEVETVQEKIETTPAEENLPTAEKTKKTQKQKNKEKLDAIEKQLTEEAYKKSLELAEKMKANLPTQEKIENKDKQNDSKKKSIFTKDEQYAINRWVGTDSYFINEALRNNDELPTNANGVNLKKVSDDLSKVLTKLPSYEGTVYRSIPLEGEKLTDFLNKYQEGNVVTEDAFTSASVGEIYDDGWNVQMEIESHTAKDTTELFRKTEHEVLFDKGSKFKVIEVDASDKDNIKIVLEDVTNIDDNTEIQFSLSDNTDKLREQLLESRNVLNDNQLRDMKKHIEEVKPGFFNENTDNLGQELSKGMQNYMKNSQAREDNKSLVRVYHTTTDEIPQFNVFNPVGTPYYRFGDQVVNYYTDSKDMSGSYASQDYVMADTKKLNTREEVEKYLNNLSFKTGNLYSVEKRDDGKFIVSQDKQISREARDFINNLNENEKQQMLENIYENEKMEGSHYDRVFSWNYFDKTLQNKYHEVVNKYIGTADLVAIQQEMMKYLETPIFLQEDTRLNGEVVSLYDTESEMLRNIKSDIQKSDWSKNSKIQYEGYVNITNPYVVDAEQRNWNQVIQESNDFIDELDERVPKDIKNNLTRLYNESANKSNESRDTYDLIQRMIMDLSNRMMTPMAIKDDIIKANQIVKKVGFQELNNYLDNNVSPGVSFWYNIADELRNQDVIGSATSSFIINEFRLPENIKNWLLDNYNEYIDTNDLPISNKQRAYSMFGTQTNLRKIYETNYNAYQEFEKYRMPSDYFIEQISSEGNDYLGYELEDMFETRAERMGADVVGQEIAQASSVAFSKPELIRLWGTSKTTNDIVKEIIASNEDGTTNYDGIIIKNVYDYGGKSSTETTPNNLYVTFNSNQFKSVDNENPTDDEDIRYSLSDSGTLQDSNGDDVTLETSEVGTHGTLMAIHNLDESKLKGIIELGGFPVPSIAIINPNVYSHDKYGDISVLFNKDTINPTNKLNETYSSDIYSSRFPEVVNEIDTDTIENLVKDGYNYGISMSGYTLEELVKQNKFNIDWVPDELMQYYFVKNGIEYTENNRDLYENGEKRNDYIKWLDEIKEASIGEKRVIRPDVDLFTPSGNRRTLEQRSLPYTLENIVKIMTKKSTKGSEGNAWVGTGEIRGNLATKFKSIDDIRSSKDNLVSSEEMQTKKNEIESEFEGLTGRLVNYYKYVDTNRWQGFDIVADSINETAKAKKITEATLKEKLKENFIENVPNELLSETINFLNKLKNAPTEYFESKPQRAVGLDEVQAIIIPNNTSAEFKQQLQDAGLTYYEYDLSIEGDRQRVINQFDDLKFSLSDEKASDYALYNPKKQFKNKLSDGLIRTEENLPVSEETTPGEEQQPEEDSKVRFNKQVMMMETKKKAYVDEYNNLKQDMLDVLNEIDNKIKKKQSEYDGKKNKDTKVAQNILQQIESLKSRRSNIELMYSNKIDKLDSKIKNFDAKVEAQKVTRSEVIAKNRNLAKEKIGDIFNIKDKSKGIKYQVNTMKRNLRDIMSKEKAADLYDTYFRPITENNAKSEKFITSYNERIQKYNLTNEESTYVQMIGEKKYNPECELTNHRIQTFYNLNENKIDKSKCERAVEEFRSIYDELIVQINDSLVQSGYKPIDYRKGYFPHFIEEKATSPIGKLAEKLGWKVKQGTLPTDIAGITDQFKPGKTWTSFSQRRTGDETDYNALKGLDNYLRGAADTIFHTEDIQKLRALENEIRYQYSDDGVKEKIDKIYADDSMDIWEKNEEIFNLTKEIKEGGLGNFATELRNYTDNLANKKAFGDRSMEQAFGRDTYSIMQNINSRVSANMVGANIGSALTNFIPITQAWSQVSTKNLMKGMYEAIQTTIKDDGFADNSTYLINRTQQADRLYKTGLDKVNDKLGIPFEAIDSFTSNTIVRAKYYDNIEKGMSEVDAMRNADEFAKDVMGGRSKGDAPTIFNQKNPLVKLVTAFQLEVNNQYGYMFKDIPVDLGDEAKEKLVGAFVKMFLGAFLYNQIAEAITGRKSAFSPIDMAIDDIKTMTNENMDLGEKISTIAQDTASELPFIGGLMGGGRLPIQGAIPYENPLEMVTETLSDASKVFDEDESTRKTAINKLVKEWSKPLYYVAMPFAGGQLKKTVEGLSMYDENLPVAGSYTNSGDLRFEADTSPWGVAQAALFGQYASKNAREYFENGYSPLSEKQVNAALEAGLNMNEYQEYQAGLKEAKKNAKENNESQSEATYDYIYNLPLTTEQKNSLLNSTLGYSDVVTDENDYVKYVDENNKTYWYDTENNELYNSNYHKIDVSKLDNLVQYSNKKDIENYGDYGSLEEFNYANKNPEKYAAITQVTDYKSYAEYKSYIEDIEDEYSDMMSKATNSKQKSAISKQKKDAVRNYINSLNLNKYQKLMLEKLAGGYSINNYKPEIQQYINSLDLTKEEKETIDSALFN